MLAKAIAIEEKDIHNVKALIALRLHEGGMTQAEISKILNMTQPMVSKYLSLKYFPLYIQKIVEKILNEEEKTGKIRFAYVALQEDINQEGEYYLSTPENIRLNEKSEVIQNISRALNLLLDKDIADIVPNVKMNIAMSIKNPFSKDDVASIPGGLITINGRLKRFNEPEFGTSRHLAQILLYAHKLRKDVNAVINIRYTQEILGKIKKYKFYPAFFSEDYTIPANKKIDILIHKGSFGIEPICYIFGKDAVEAVERCKLIGG